LRREVSEYEELESKLKVVEVLPSAGVFLMIATGSETVMLKISDTVLFSLSVVESVTRYSPFPLKGTLIYVGLPSPALSNLKPSLPAILHLWFWMVLAPVGSVADPSRITPFLAS